MPPQGVDMSAIQEALARRQSGGLGPGGMPAMQQQTQPMQAPPVPGGVPMAPPQQSGPQSAPGAPGQAQGGQGAPKPNASFDDETKAVSKALIARLLKVL